MKKITTFVITVLTASNLISAVSAKEAAPNIATIDSNKILQSYPEAQTIVQDINRLEAELNKKIKSKREELEKAKAAGKTETELQLMAEKMRQEIEPEAKRIEEDSRKRSDAIETNIHEAIQSTAKEGKYDLVLSKDAVLYGGVDISDSVVKKLTTVTLTKGK